jgi:hypothetical protein
MVIYFILNIISPSIKIEVLRTVKATPHSDLFYLSFIARLNQSHPRLVQTERLVHSGQEKWGDLLCDNIRNPRTRTKVAVDWLGRTPGKEPEGHVSGQSIRTATSTVFSEHS